MSDTTRLTKALHDIARVNNELIAAELAITKAEQELEALQERKLRLLAKLQSAILSSEPVDADAS